ncbi:MAG TPA: hypothetical protein VGF49_04820 [Candidatus Solibacter sp.]
MELLFASDAFRSSRRCQSFLEFAVDRTLTGRAAELREKVIGVEVFQRSPGYDSNDDPVVRATAGDVRKRLAQYYQDPARAGELRIEMLPGSYVPEFRMPVPQAPAELPRLETQTVPPRDPAPIDRRSALGLLGTGSLAAAGWWIVRPAFSNSGFERFWAPLLSAGGSVLICVGQAKLYNFPRSVGPDVERALDPRRAPDASSPKAEALLNNIRPVWDRYVPLGDAEALSRFAILFDRKNKPFRVRGSALTSLADLREGPAVLIGGFSNDWTLRVSRDLRYRMARSEDFRLYVEDNRNLALRNWVGPKDDITTGNSEGADFTDYAIISRVFEPTTGRPMICIGGITHLATAAAGEFLTTPASVDDALKAAPKGWDRKNVQMVIETKVIGHGATPPRLLALHVW